MSAGIQRAAAALVLYVVAVLSVAQDRPDNRSLTISDLIKAEETAIRLQESAVALRRLALDYTEAQAELAEKRESMKALSETLVVAQSDAARLRQRCQDLERQVSVMSANAQGDAGKLATQLVEATQALRQSEQDRQQLMDQMARLNAVLEQARRSSEGMSLIQRAQTLAESERTKRLLAQQQQQDVTLTTTNGTNGVLSPSQASLQNGQVIDLNVNLQLVALNVGEAHGVRLGMPFEVVRDDRVIARVKVVEVRKKISGAVIENMDREKAIRVGDRVRVTKS